MPEVPSEDEERAHEKQQAADCAVEYVQSGVDLTIAKSEVLRKAS